MSSFLSSKSQRTATTCTRPIYVGKLHLVGTSLITDHKNIVNGTINDLNKIEKDRRDGKAFMTDSEVDEEMAQKTLIAQQESAVSIQKSMSDAGRAIKNLPLSERAEAMELWDKIIPGFLTFWNTALEGIMSAILVMKDWIVGVVKSFKYVRRHLDAALRAFDKATEWLRKL